MNSIPTARRIVTFTLLACAPAASASAQTIFAIHPAASELPVAMQTGSSPVFATEREALLSGQRPFVVGQVPDFRESTAHQAEDSRPAAIEGKSSIRYHPSLTYMFRYGDGIPASPGHVYKTELHDITPGILIEAGDHWTVDYAPTWSYYSNDAFEDVVGHHAAITGGGTHVDWTWGFLQKYAVDHDVILETAAQTLRESWDTDFRLALQLNSKLMIDSSFQQHLRHVEAYADTREWSNFTWLHYNLSPRLNGGVGLGGGYLEMEGPDVYFFQAQGRISWKPTDRVTLSITGGADRRFSYSDSVPARTSPIYGATFSYRPFPYTEISVDGHRAVQPSYFQTELVDWIGWGASISQRFFGRLTGSLKFGRESSDYVATSAGANPNRNDDFSSFDARLSTRIREHGTIAVFLRDTKNDSSSDAYSTTSSQFGFELGLRF